MLKYGQEQDNVFEIIEKGNFFTPTKGEESAPAYAEHSSKRAKWIQILKWAVITAGSIWFVTMLVAFFLGKF